MHVILKPFIKIFIWIFAILGIAELAGVDVDELLNNLMGTISGDDTDTDEDVVEETTEA